MSSRNLAGPCKHHKSLCFVGLGGKFQIWDPTVLPRFGPMPAWRLKSVPCCVPCRHKPARRGVRVSERRMQPKAPARMPPTSALIFQFFYRKLSPPSRPPKAIFILMEPSGPADIRAPCWKPRVARFLPLTATRRRWPMPVLWLMPLARLTLVEGCFGDMEALAQAAGFAELDGAMLDLGVRPCNLISRHAAFFYARRLPICAWAQPAPAPKSC